MAIDKRTIYNLNPDESPKNHQLKSIEWAIITQLDGEKTVQQIADTLSLNDEEIETHFSRLLEFNIIGSGNEQEEIEYVDPEIIQKIENELTLLVGPVAGIIIDDIIIEMNVTRESIPVGKIGLFAELVSNEIGDDQKKMNFLETILPQINRL